MTIDELSAQLKSLESKVAQLIDEQVKTRRSQEDALANLDYENMPIVAKIIRSSESGLASVSATVDSVSSSIDGIVYFVDPTTGITSEASESLVASINGSSYSVYADKIDFTGFTTFAKAEDLNDYATLSGLNGGTTTIDGGCITTGSINTSLLSVDGSGYADIPMLGAQTISWSGGEGTSLMDIYSYYGIDIYSPDGNISITANGMTASITGYAVEINTSGGVYGGAYYNGSEIATLSDIDDIVPVFG